ncbi:MAG: site-specific DNA-methyltransferase [Actinobacteria bacterium]|nr:site-specific DNA-methyltransferase [Actinomycetota bacterium]
MGNKDYQNWSKAELIKEIKQLKEPKKYGLVWEDKKEEVVEMCKEKLPIVKEVKNKEIITDKNKPVNLLIEGDNYHALSVLNYTHEKKVDVIYIDPPYNTGNKDFIFNDKYIDKEDSYRHSKWLSFIEKRLRLAKNLLKDTGVIFISIDDNEVAQLKLLLDNPSMFGEKNFISLLKWKKKKQPSYLHGQVAGLMEYILVYGKKITKVDNLSLDTRENINTRVDNSSNAISERVFKKGVRVKLPKEIEMIKKGIYKNKTMQTEYLSDVLIKNGRTINDVIVRTRFRNNQEQINEFIEKDVLFITKNFGLRRDLLPRDLEKRKSITDLLLDWGDNQDSDKELRNFFENKPFEYPKPVLLIKNLIKSVNFRDGIVLDFMAGTGTTAHAVLELNKEDDGNRQFILCTNNENNNGNGYKIAEDICYPRLKKVIEGYKNLKGEWVEGLGGNLKYFKTDFVDAEPTDKNKRKLTDQVTEMICIKEGTFEPVLDRTHFKIFKNNNHYAGIILDQLVIPEFKKVIKDINGKFSIYVFSLSDETFDEEFSDVKQKIKLSPIPEAILKVYRRIFK